MPQNPPQPGKATVFFKKYWWLLLLPIIIGATAIVFLISPSSNSDNKENRAPVSTLDDRIVASFLPDSGAAFKYNSPTIVDEKIYIGTSTKLRLDGDHKEALDTLPDNYFYKMDLDLNVIWSYPFGKAMVVGAAVLDSQKNIYFLTETFELNTGSFDENVGDGKTLIYLTTLKFVSLTNDGVLRWEKTIGEDEPWDHSMFNPAISADDKIYFGHERLYRYDSSGALEWEFPGKTQKLLGFNSSPIIDKAGNVYFVSPEPVSLDSEYGTETIRAYKFNPGGDIVWSSVLGNEPRLGEGPTEVGGQRASSDYQKITSTVSIPAFGLDEESLYAMVGCTANKVDTGTGEVLWSLLPDGATGSFIASPAIDSEGNLYVGTKSNLESTLFAISSDGEMLWSNMIGADLYTSPLIGDDDMIYTGSETTDQGKYYKIDILTGEIQWVIGRSVSDFTMDSGALYQGYVYIGVHECPNNSNNQPKKTLFKIQADTDSYQSGSPWPRFHGGNENTGRSAN